MFIHDLMNNLGVLNIHQWSYDPTSGAVWKYVICCVHVCMEMYMHA